MQYLENILLIFTLAPGFFFAFEQAFDICTVCPDNNGKHYKGKGNPVAAVKEIIAKGQGCIQG